MCFIILESADVSGGSNIGPISDILAAILGIGGQWCAATNESNYFIGGKIVIDLYS